MRGRLHVNVEMQTLTWFLHFKCRLLMSPLVSDQLLFGVAAHDVRSRVKANKFMLFIVFVPDEFNPCGEDRRTSQEQEDLDSREGEQHENSGDC